MSRPAGRRIATRAALLAVTAAAVLAAGLAGARLVRARRAARSLQEQIREVDEFAGRGFLAKAEAGLRTAASSARSERDWLRLLKRARAIAFATGSYSELSALAQKSQDTHQKMLAKIDEAKKIKTEADTLHQAYLQAREKIKPLEEERRKLMEQRRQLYESQRQLHESQRQQDEASRKTAEQALKERLESEAREKLQRGEKLSWDEFQLLAEDDESETQD